ncbi:MAG: anthranilate phosphoribosyltransferase [Acidimicrobiales bacterium]|nr:anthranilate phosphoribosyltransferase [Acidimicrobiales bacterium]
MLAAMTAVTLDDLGGWPVVLGTLTGGGDLTGTEAAAAMHEILEGNASSAQIAGFIVALRMKGETVEELTGLVQSMADMAVRVPLATLDGVVDIVGTGGDRSHSINVSTLAALVIAGAGGKVCKHGNRAASSSCGAADLLEALGVAFDLGPVGVARCVETVGMGFCFAPRFHGAMRHAIPTRRELGVPTVFNVLGPLANPGRVRRQVTGVADPAMAERMIRVLAANGAERALVVYGHDGLDELTITTTSTVHELHDGEIRTYVVDPVELGIEPASLDQLRGGDAATNARFARELLAGAPGPQRDIVVLNAAAGLVAAGMATDIAAGLDAARASIDSGRAAATLDHLVTESNAARREEA